MTRVIVNKLNNIVIQLRIYSEIDKKLDLKLSTPLTTFKIIWYSAKFLGFFNVSLLNEINFKVIAILHRLNDNCLN